MRDFIILNGVNSQTIAGLLIQNLPPITKPRIRTNVEEIDGRDGDIVTLLGYGAYDKKFEIGLYGSFDINEIIEYFNSSGTVIFSNEEDKYYNYLIVDPIDFEKLIRYKTAIVTMHVQPFKYSVNDNKQIFNINSNLLSFGNYTGKSNGITLTVSNGTITVKGTATRSTEFYVPINSLSLNEGDYTLSAIASGTGVTSSSIRLINGSPADASSFGGTYMTLQNDTSVTLQETLTETATYDYLWFYITSGVAMNYTLDVNVTNDDPANSISIRNVGNIYSKPIITIEGTGTIEISLNNHAIFMIDMSNFDEITIDTNLMQAYNDTQLLNRYVTGDYNNFFLNVGNNLISWTGSITAVTIENFSRWI